MKKIIIVLVIVIISAILSGCVDNVPAKVASNSNTIILIKEESIINTRGAISVLHDNQYNVTCWTNWEMTHGGISCIPDSQLNMSK